MTDYIKEQIAEYLEYVDCRVIDYWADIENGRIPIEALDD